MKYAQHTGSSRPAPALKSILSGLAIAACLGFTMNAQAQDCTINNWLGTPVNASAMTASVQSGGNDRRYGGPCGLRVDLTGEPTYLTDPSPTGSEVSYIVRFYAFLDDVEDETIIFEARDSGGDPQIDVVFTPGDGLNVGVRDTGTNEMVGIPVSVSSGWASIQIFWEAGTSDNVRVAVNVDDDLAATEAPAGVIVQSINTSDGSIASAHLGNIAGSSGGYINFDDFDSRRISLPNRLMPGDATNNGQVNLGDVIAIRAEFLGQGEGPYAAGQPDCNENGVINLGDVICARSIFLSSN